MKKIVFFHRNKKCGYSINKVTQTVICNISDKDEFFVPCCKANIFSILKNIIFIFLHRDRHAINHITGDIHYGIIGLIGCKSILTVHDTGGVDFHQYPLIKRFIFELLWYKLPLNLANHIVCISNETKKAVLRYTKRVDIDVIHNALDPAIEYSPKSLNLDQPQILIIGTLPNKNLLRTFEALSGITCNLVIIGKLNSIHIESLKKNNIHYINKFNLSDCEIIEEYKKCDIVSFVSLYEGFGMPVIEANAIGRPVVCSDIPVLREVGCNSALFVNPYDVSSIKNAFLSLIKDRFLCNDLVNKGRNNVLRFNKDLILKQWKELYHSI